MGNHEYYTPGAEGYFSYFGAQAGPDRRGYYSFDHGGWHFISLNSNIDASPGSAQYQWLAADLASFGATLCTIAYWHYPVFSSGQHGNVPHMAKVFEALQAAGVDIVLSGHDHVYERFAPQNADGVADPARGIREFVVGTGGAEHYRAGGAASQQRGARQHLARHPAADARPKRLQLAVRAGRRRHFWRCRHRRVPPLKRGWSDRPVTGDVAQVVGRLPGRNA